MSVGLFLLIAVIADPYILGTVSWGSFPGGNWETHLQGHEGMLGFPINGGPAPPSTLANSILTFPQDHGIIAAKKDGRDIWKSSPGPSGREERRSMMKKETPVSLEAIHPLEKRALSLAGQARRFLLIVLAAMIMAANMKSFVNAGGLFPGGFNGLTLLIQRSAQQFGGISLPFTPINLALNVFPILLGFWCIGKWFTLYSCLMIALTSVFTDLLPSMPLTDDILLVSVFGGIINGLSISLCLLGRATSGGTDFISVAIGERLGRDGWYPIFFCNCLMLAVAGVLFGWDKALYSVIFQFASTQVVRMLNARYKRNTLFIISDDSEEIYDRIRQTTHHSATMFHGTGLYNGEPRTMLYTVISGDQVKEMTKTVREIDPHAFINVIKTDQVAGNFYQQPDD